MSFLRKFETMQCSRMILTVLLICKNKHCAHIRQVRISNKIYLPVNWTNFSWERDFGVAKVIPRFVTTERPDSKNDQNRCPTFSGDRKGPRGPVHSEMFQGADEDLPTVPYVSLGWAIEFISCSSSIEFRRLVSRKKNRPPVCRR